MGQTYLTTEQLSERMPPGAKGRLVAVINGARSGFRSADRPASPRGGEKHLVLTRRDGSCLRALGPSRHPA